MTTLLTRARLLSTVLRTGDMDRIVRLVDRLEHRDIAGVLPVLDHLDLRRLAAALCGDERIERTITELDTESLARLALAASPADLARLLTALSEDEPRRIATTLLALPEEARHLALTSVDARTQRVLTRALPRRARPKTSDDRIVAALRLRRLFA